jgi:hypothetical protein
MSHGLLLAALDRMSVGGQNEIAGHQARFLRRRAHRDVAHDHPRTRTIGFQARLHRDARPAANHPAVFDQAVRDDPGEIARDCAAEIEDADFVDANDLAAVVHQRSAAVPAENLRVVQNPAHQRADVFSAQVKASRGLLRQHERGIGYDAARHRLRKKTRAAQRKHHISRRQFIGVAKLGDDERRRSRRPLREVELQHGEIGQGILSEPATFDMGAVVEITAIVVAVLRHVAVGDDVALGRDDHAATGGPLLRQSPVAGAQPDDLDAHDRREDARQHRVFCRRDLGGDRRGHGSRHLGHGEGYGAERQRNRQHHTRTVAHPRGQR